MCIFFRLQFLFFLYYILSIFHANEFQSVEIRALIFKSSVATALTQTYARKKKQYGNKDKFTAICVVQSETSE